MDVTIRTDDAEAAGSLRAYLDDAGDFELTSSGSRSIEVVAGAGKVSALASALLEWLDRQPPGSVMTVDANMTEQTVRAGDPRAEVLLRELLTREERSGQEESGLGTDWPGLASGRGNDAMFGPPPGPDFDKDA
jgi:hypothetical protein